MEGQGLIDNPQLSEMMKEKGSVDVLYHLGLNSSMDLEGMFGDVRFVLMAGSPLRAKAIAESVVTQLDIKLPVGTELAPVGKTERYVLYKVGPVLACSHGIGMPSMSILLHEVAKLLHYAKVPRDQLVFIRLGTCGGLGVPPGTQVVTRRSLDGLFRPEHRYHCLGKEVVQPTSLDEGLIESLLAAAGDDIPALVGDTIAADDFYLEQGRVDGAFCDHTEADKLNWLKQAHAAGVRNIEMESRMFAAFCNRMKVSLGSSLPGLISPVLLLASRSGGLRRAGQPSAGRPSSLHVGRARSVFRGDNQPGHALLAAADAAQGRDLPLSRGQAAGGRPPPRYRDHARPCPAAVRQAPPDLPCPSAAPAHSQVAGPHAFRRAFRHSPAVQGRRFGQIELDVVSCCSRKSH